MRDTMQLYQVVTNIYLLGSDYAMPVVHGLGRIFIKQSRDIP